MERDIDDTVDGRSQSSFAVTRFIVVAAFFAGFMAWLGVQAVSFYTRDNAEIDWGGARWISLPEAAATGYFRMNFLAPGKVNEAYVRIAATDSFKLYVNGSLLADSKFYSFHPSQMIDIAAYIKPGMNVIAIRVARETYGSGPELIVNGVWRSGAQTGLIRSNLEWKVFAQEAHQLSGAVQWYDSEFIDSAWPSATLAAAGERLVVPLRPWFDEAMMARFPNGHWVWSREDYLRATFRREVELEGRRLEQAWLGISAHGIYILTVNDVLVVPSAAITEEYMDVYDIAPYLRQGKNVVTVDVSDDERGGRVLVSGAARLDGRWVDFSSDHRWLANGVVSSGDRELHSADQPVKIWSAMQAVATRLQVRQRADVVNGFPTLRAQEIKYTRQLTWHESMRMLSVALVVFAVVACGAVVFVTVLGWWVPVSKGALLGAYTKPYLLAVIVLVFVFLYSFDVRAVVNKSFSLSVFAAMAGLIAFSVMAMFLETLLRARRLGGKSPV